MTAIAGILRRIGAASAVFVLSSALPLAAQTSHTDPAFSEVPFAEWIAQPARPQIPWKTKVMATGLSWHQRLVAQVAIQVDGKELFKRKDHGEILAYVQVTDRAGTVYQDHGVMELEHVEKSTRGGVASFTLDMFVLPGNYEVALALYDRAANEHSAIRVPLRIEPLKDDPLPESWSGLPTVELLGRREKFEAQYRPDISTKLQLPLVTGSPVEVEILVALNSRESGNYEVPLESMGGAFPRSTFGGIRSIYSPPRGYELWFALPMLKVLSDLDVRQGSLRVTVLDLLRRTVVFDQGDLGELDWQNLGDAIQKSDPGSIDVKTLQGMDQRADFLRQVLERWLSAAGVQKSERKAVPSAAMGGVPSQKEPERVLIMLSAPIFFSAWRKPPQVAAPPHCNCRLYYVAFLQGGEADDLRRILKPVPLHVFPAQKPIDARKALAAILEELRKL